MWSLVESVVVDQCWEAIQGEDASVASSTVVESPLMHKTAPSIPHDQVEYHEDSWYKWRRFWAWGENYEVAYVSLTAQWKDQWMRHSVATVSYTHLTLPTIYSV